MDTATLIEKAKDVFGARQVIGEPFEKNGATVLPVVSVRGGGGGGSGDAAEGKPGGEGVGFGITARPVGAYVVRGDDVRWVPAVDVSRIVLGAQIVAITALLVARSIVRAKSTRPHATGDGRFGRGS